jgi:hypothetical protein
MFFTIAVLVTAAAVLTIYKARTDRTDLGWMSEQWLAEHRASHLF